MIRKFFIGSLLSALLLGGAYYFIRQRNNKLLIPHKDFAEWYAANFGNKKEPAKKTDAPIYSYVYESPPLKIDTIFRSMQGPLSAENIRLNDGSNRLSRFLTGPELYWLVGYSVDMVDASTDQKISDDFMCHNNLDLQNKALLPWEIQTQGTFSRMFTLTEGLTKVMLPKGFGIPTLSNVSLVINSQVLNHNFPNINIKVKHKVTIYYVKESELSAPLKPLYQQAAFVTKHVSGPEGEYGAPIDVFAKKDSSNLSSVIVSKKEDTCCTGKFTGGYDPYKDNFGRIFTGHWKFDPGVEVLRADVTRMLSIKKDTKVHYIAVHVHPFCTSLELVDLTEGRSVFKAVNENFSDKIGLKKIDHFESEEGVTMYKDHRYQLISTYTNTTQNIHTAMATMFLYLEE